MSAQALLLPNQYPLLTPEIISDLNRRFPLKAIEKGQGLEDAWKMAGRREVIDFLANLSKLQNNNVLSIQSAPATPVGGDSTPAPDTPIPQRGGKPRSRWQKLFSIFAPD